MEHVPRPPRRTWRSWLAALAILLAASGARADEAKLPPLRHGVSLSAWLANAQRQPLSNHDFEQIKATGFDHVRIPINPEFLGFSLTEASTGRVLFDFEQVDQAINMARNNGLAVVLDIDPSEGFHSLLEQDTRAETGFISLWERIAGHYKGLPTDFIAFEILNEPKYESDPAGYADLMADLVAAIRAIVPKHLIILDAPRNATVDSLRDFTPLKDSNIVYAFHFFEPELFTRQGLNYGSRGKVIRFFHQLPYPSSLADSNVDYTKGGLLRALARQEVVDYALANWDGAHIRARIQSAAEWASANHVRVICTAFGARRAFITAPQRYQWIADTRKALDANAIPWDVWDYTDLFGITRLVGKTITEPADGSVKLADPDKGSREIENEAIKALFSP